MINKSAQSVSEQTPVISIGIVKRKRYAKPKLEQLGNLLTLTLGGSPGEYESGNPFLFKP